MIGDGSRVRLAGGYDANSSWLGSSGSLTGAVVMFIPGQGEQPAAVVHLDDRLDTEEGSGQFVVLELRYTKATWVATKEMVHVELCDFVPEARTWKDRRQGIWLESHATVNLIPKVPV